MTYQQDRVFDVWAAVTKQALADHRAGWHRKDIPSAYVYLKAAGLIDARGQLDHRVPPVLRPQRSRKTNIATTPAATGA